MTVPDVTADLEAAAQRVKDLSDKVAAQAKNLLDMEEQAAKGTGVEWATTLATQHANFVRDTSEVWFAAISKQLKS